jgi:pimeloyl-ACP methyl ester carboxylesterase
MDVAIAGDGVDLAGTDVGEGPAVVLLHAGGERRAVWDPVIAPLAAAGHRCIAVDQRGHGASPATGADRFDSYAGDAVALCDGLGAPVVLVGASLGGFAALAAAVARPATVAGVVLVDVVPDPEPDHVRAVLPGVVIGDAAGSVADRLVTEILGRSGEMRAALAGIDRPVLLARGTTARSIGDAAVARYRALAPRGRLVAVAGAGHLVARDRPAALARAVLAFLSSPAVRARHDPRPDQPVTARDRAGALLDELGAAAVDHLGSDLLTHLEGTETRLRSWGAPEDLALAGLGHATYGTDGFAHPLLEVTERSRLREAIGADAERIVYRYASCDRAATYPGLGRRPLVLRDRFTGRTHALDDSEARQFALLSAANELDLVDRDLWDDHGVAEIVGFVRRLEGYAPDTLGAVLRVRAPA